MRYRKLADDGDMQFGTGLGLSAFHKDTPEAVAQAVMTRLKLFKGEFFINTEAGVPYNTKVLGFGNMHVHNITIKEAIVKTPGVIRITEYSSFVDKERNLIIQATIDTIYGSAIINTGQQ